MLGLLSSFLTNYANSQIIELKHSHTRETQGEGVPVLKARIVCVALCAIGLQGAFGAEPIASVVVQTLSGPRGSSASFDGVVEAVRQTTLAAQVPGAIVALSVKAGDSVRAGQELLRLDARAANQNSNASQAQVDAARASAHLANQDYERQKQLFQKQYISQAAMERAQAQWLASQAQVRALEAQSVAAQTQSGFFSLHAPYAARISEVPVALGDMAMPGRALVSLYDPSALRVTVALPQSVLGDKASLQAAQIELSGQGAERIRPTAVELLPQIDPVTHTAQLRLTLPAAAAAAPGQFARAWLAGTTGVNAGISRNFVPSASIVHRAELAAVYVIDAQDRPLLRQVRLGQVQGDQIEILSGVQQGERVAIDPQAAAKAR